MSYVHFFDEFLYDISTMPLSSILTLPVDDITAFLCAITVLDLPRYKYVALGTTQ